MPSVFRDPVGWTEKAVGTTARFVFLCASTLGFWALAMAAMHLAVRVSVSIEEADPTSPAFHGFVWALVYIVTFVGFVVMPVLYLIALQGILMVVRTRNKTRR